MFASILVTALYWFRRGCPRGIYFLVAALVFFFLTGFSKNGYTLPSWAGGREILILLLAFLAGNVFVPVLLPWLPGGHFH